jgi:hypothetical protein
VEAIKFCSRCIGVEGVAYIEGTVIEYGPVTPELSNDLDDAPPDTVIGELSRI